ncbi:hypothetical protein Leryth_012762 [Lithospermum erythrorhizon]|nr:hypothetical protein Leryth_012762 [Lithospermum erythrorhizon]
MAVDNETQQASLRRTSARIQKLKAADVEKASKYKEVEENEEDYSIEKQIKRSKKKARMMTSSSGEVVEVVKPEVVVEENHWEVEVVKRETERLSLEGCGDDDERSDFAKVTKTLRLFNKYYLHFVQEEEKRCNNIVAQIKEIKKTLNSKENKVNDEDLKRPSQRPDLKAITKIKDNKSVLYPQKRCGSIPGIEVGHQFFSRAEMVVIGFHHHWLSGIDYIGKSAGTDRQVKDFVKNCNDVEFPIAISIVMSGQYEDDQDNSEAVIYTGQGGNNLLGDKRQIGDQKMERGNLALKNTIEHGLPVRVTRGHQCKSSYVKKVYTYDGLYKVVKYWAENGLSGFTVYKFRLERLENQPPLTTAQVQFSRGRIPTSLSEIRGLVCEDISFGQENIPIPATNLVDDPPVAPTDLTYIRYLKISQNVKLPPPAEGCGCRGACTDSRVCACAKLNGHDFPYVSRDGGRLVEPKAVVFECGKNCKCGPDCVNRTSQKGIRYRLEVFRTPNKGWGVRSWDYIPAGAPICEYIGVLMKSEDVDTTRETNYMFDIDCLHTMKGLDGRERRIGDVQLPRHLQMNDSDAGPEFCIDADSIGNVARYINHSCQPNLFVQCVLSDHHDLKQARIVLFAADNIPPLTEFSYDYAYELDSVIGPDGVIKQLACYCGAADCRKRLF